MSRLSVQYVTNASPVSGVGHRAEEIAKRLRARSDVTLTQWQLDGESATLLREAQEVGRIRPWPGVLGSKSVTWVRLGTKFKTLNAKGKNDDGTLFHFTNQTLSYLARGLQPAVVTVHDIIELLEPQDRRAQWINAYLYGGIRMAQQVICVSEFTKRQVMEHCGVPEDNITVIHNGVGSEFHPIEHFKQTLAYQDVRHRLKVPEDARVVLSVGSDHPRKNLVTAVHAFARMKNIPAVLVKVGAAGLPAGRAMLLEEIDRLGIRESIRFIERVSTDELNTLYNVADVLLFPSRYEGFGLPLLQAMAAGTPVITSNSSSLPEVVGDAAITHDADDVEGFTKSLAHVLVDPTIAAELREKGLQQAQRFSWDKATEQVVDVYQHINASG